MLRSLALLLPIAACVAADYGILDLRVGGGVVSGSGDIALEVETPGGRASGDIAGFDPGYRASIGLFQSFGPINRHGSPLLGLVLNYSEFSRDADGDWAQVDATAVSFDLHAGYGIALSRWLHVEARGFLGGGGLRVAEQSAGTLVGGGTAGENRSRGSGPWYEGGLAAGAYWTVTEGVQFGLDLGGIAYRGKAVVDWVNERDEYAFTGIGPFAQLSLGLRM